MPKFLRASAFEDERGTLSVVDSGVLPFEVRRVFYIHSIPQRAVRGGHAHLRTDLAISCLAGGCTVMVGAIGSEEAFTLDSPQDILIVQAGEWHELRSFKEGTVVLALASEPFDPEDYVYGR